MLRLFFEALIGGHFSDARYLGKTLLARWM